MAGAVHHPHAARAPPSVILTRKGPILFLLHLGALFLTPEAISLDVLKS